MTNSTPSSAMNAVIKFFNNSVYYILLTVIIGLIAWFSLSYFKTFDLTAAQRNTLSPTTQKLLSQIDKPIQFVAYVPDDATVHAGLKKRVAQYQSFKKDTSLEIINPELNPERAKQDGISAVGELVVKLDDKKEIIRTLQEQDIVNTLQRLVRKKDLQVVFIEGHGELSIFETKNDGLSILKEALEKQGFNFQAHTILKTQNIPSSASFVVLASPSEAYLDSEIEIIKEYLAGGGNLLWLSNANSDVKLEKLTEFLNINIQDGTIVDANQQLQSMLGIKHPAVIAVVDYDDYPFTESLEQHTIFPFATAVLKANAIENTDSSFPNWNHQEFLRTLGTAWLESGSLEGNVGFDVDNDVLGPLPIGASLTRDVDAANSDTKKNQRVIVIGDSDFAQNNFIGQGGNLALLTNLFNWLATEDDLIQIEAIKSADSSIDIQPWLLYSIGFFFLIFLPLLLLVIGFWRWRRRRNV